MSGSLPTRVVVILTGAYEGPCPNLQPDMRCGIYEQRPLVCRIYPAEIKSQGFATATRTRRLVDEYTISVPVPLNDRTLAALTVRFIAPALPLKTGIERFLPKLRQCAAKISTVFSEQQAKADAQTVPRATV